MNTAADAPRTAFRTCPLCEAGCGLEITVKQVEGQERVTRIRGDLDDVFSHGFICPKGSTLKQLHDDPDRLRAPLVKRDGRHVEVSWEEAWVEVHRLLNGVIEQHGREAVAVYLGNPGAHSLSALTFNRVMLQGLGTRQRYSASTVDQMPKQVSAGYMFGTPLSIPIPDLDRTDYLLMLGANPYASNGSLCTAPDFPGRLDALRERGGRLVVVDPRRSRTAEAADEWLPIRPGADGLFLAAIAQVLLADGLADPGDHVRTHIEGWDEVATSLAEFTPEVVAAATGLDAATIRRIAHELAAAPSAAVYGRIGTTTTQFGTTTSWLVDVVNILSGNLDRPGGVMFTQPVAGGSTTRGTPGRGSGLRIGRGHTRVDALPEVCGEYPVAALAAEITTQPRDDSETSVRALVTVAGNPVLSTPASERLDAALGQLDAMISVDIYLNETTRHADVILPPPSALQRGHYDLALLQLAIRNVANYSPPVLERDAGQPDEWEILAKIGLIGMGQGPDADPAVADDFTASALVHSAVRDESSAVHGRDPEELLAMLAAEGRTGPERLLDVMLRTGPYGDGFGTRTGGVTLLLLEEHPHGIDYGALEPRLPEVLRTPSGKVEMAPPEIVADLPRMRTWMQEVTTTNGDAGLVLVGRRHLRSNNSWMHNIEVLVKGKARCTLQVHPDDAARLGLSDGSPARVTSRVGSIDAPVEVTDAIRPGVVSLPHGWGHNQPGTRMSVARERAGVNSNVLSDHEAMDPLSGTSVLNGIPVTVVRAD